MSVQGNEGAYCSPRNDEGPYDSVEVGFPSVADTLLQPYAEDSSKLTDTVYGWVPSTVVLEVLQSHGGWVDGEIPPMVLESDGCLVDVEE